MARQTLPRGDLLSLVGAGAAARAPEEAPLSDPKIEHGEQPRNGNDAKRIARRAIAPKGKAAGAAHAETRTPPKQPVPVEPSRKQKFNSRLAPELADAVRNCVVALSGPPERLTIDSFAADTDPLMVQLIPAARQLSGALTQLGRLAPQLEGFFRGFRKTAIAGRTGFPALQNFIDTELPPFLDEFTPFFREVTPILVALNRYRREVTSFLGNAAAVTNGEIGIDPVRPLAGQPEQHGAVGGVALAGERERAVEVRLDTHHLVEQALVAQRLDKAAGRGHRSHRVRTRRADADLEQVESA